MHNDITLLAPLLVGEHEVHEVALAPGPDDRHDRAQGRQQLRERVRADVPERAVLLAPR